MTREMKRTVMAYPEKDKAVEEFGEAIHDFLMEWPESEKGKAVKQSLMDDLWQEMEYGAIDRMSETIEGFVSNMADRGENGKSPHINHIGDF